MESLEDRIKKFLSIGDGSGYGSGYGSGDGDGYGSGSGDGYGDGYGSGSGDGYGYGSGDGSGDGYGSGSGYGSGDGDGYGSGSGDGDGYGDGYGSGSGDGYGYGSGSGDGYGLKSYNNRRIYYIDDVRTLIDNVHGNIAVGSVIQNDLTLKPCYIARIGNSFAHGDTAREAMADAVTKEMQNKPEDERVAEFVKAHPDIDAEYPCEDLFRWHNTLTGSCEMGRRTFCQDNGIDLKSDYTVRYFLEITKNAYGGSVIKKVLEEYE